MLEDLYICKSICPGHCEACLCWGGSEVVGGGPTWPDRTDAPTWPDRTDISQMLLYIYDHFPSNSEG